MQSRMQNAENKKKTFLKISRHSGTSIVTLATNKNGNLFTNFVRILLVVFVLILYCTPSHK